MNNIDTDAMLDDIEPKIKALRESLLKYWPEESGVIKALGYIEMRASVAISKEDCDILIASIKEAEDC